MALVVGLIVLVSLASLMALALCRAAANDKHVPAFPERRDAMQRWEREVRAYYKATRPGNTER